MRGRETMWGGIQERTSRGLEPGLERRRAQFRRALERLQVKGSLVLDAASIDLLAGALPEKVKPVLRSARQGKRSLPVTVDHPDLESCKVYVQLLDGPRGLFPVSVESLSPAEPDAAPPAEVGEIEELEERAA